MTRVKICGITNLADALAAAEAGADYLGFIFYPPSPRSIELKTARAIARRLQREPDCPILVGVFVNETAARMAEILDGCGLDLAQLSGDEPPDAFLDPGSPLHGRAYKAIRPTSPQQAHLQSERYRPSQRDDNSPALLIDAYHPTLHGGTGKMADWAVAARLAETVSGLMLAGGLTPDNVADAIRAVQPFAVDVASGVEAEPGRKDHGRVRAFIRTAKDT